MINKTNLIAGGRVRDNRAGIAASNRIKLNIAVVCNEGKQLKICNSYFKKVIQISGYIVTNSDAVAR